MVGSSDNQAMAGAHAHDREEHYDPVVAAPVHLNAAFIAAGVTGDEYGIWVRVADIAALVADDSEFSELGEWLGDAIALLDSEIVDIVNACGPMSEAGGGQHGKDCVGKRISVEFQCVERSPAKDMESSLGEFRAIGYQRLNSGPKAMEDLLGESFALGVIAQSVNLNFAG
jgi:hypothetical protein